MDLTDDSIELSKDDLKDSSADEVEKLMITRFKKRSLKKLNWLTEMQKIDNRQIERAFSTDEDEEQRKQLKQILKKSLNELYQDLRFVSSVCESFQVDYVKAAVRSVKKSQEICALNREIHRLRKQNDL